MEVWITCPECGQKVLSSRMKPGQLLRVHRAVCSLRTLDPPARPAVASSEGRDVGDEVPVAAP